MAAVHHRLARYDVIAAVFGVFFVAVVVTLGDLSARQFSSLLGVMTVTGIIARTITYFTVMTTLERALAFLLLTTVLIGAIGAYRLDQAGAPASGVIWWIIAHRLLCLLAVFSWPWWVGRTGTTRERLAKGFERSV